jgi:signal transduction histidine kinase
VEIDMAPAETVGIALRLLPGTKRVVVVGGVSPYDREQLANVKEELKAYERRVDISYLTDLAMPDLLERLRHLPGNTVVLLTSMGADAAGTSFNANELGSLVAGAANAPVFSLFDVYLNHGEVGGYLSSLSEQGKVAGGMALRILRGENPWEIPKVKGVDTYMFDWRALKRWGLKESGLPPGSIVLYRQPTAWESYKGYIISGISVILLEALLIGGLVWQQARRRKVEAQLATTSERLRLAVTAGKAVGWDWDIGSGRDSWFGDLQTMFGIQSNTYSEHIEEFRRRIHPEDRKLVWKAVANAIQDHKPYISEFRIVHSDGTVRWITANGSFYYTVNGRAKRMLGIAVDITERKQVEEGLANLSGRLISAQEEERKRIAREIHDDYSQQLALLAMDLENLEEETENPSANQKLHQIWNGIGEIGADLHSLSHRLHSSTLDTLGLVAGANAFCTEFAEQQEIRVDFADENVPRDVPGDAALCLFRIVQEGLRNIKRHSGADRAEVRLECSGEKLHLSVADRGRGFDVNNRSPRSGIGIRSMEERLRSLGGHLEINSRPTEGTRIDAWLPLRVPDGSINARSGVLKQLDIHVSPGFQQELVDPTGMSRRADLPGPSEG